MVSRLKKIYLRRASNNFEVDWIITTKTADDVFVIWVQLEYKVSSNIQNNLLRGDSLSKWINTDVKEWLILVNKHSQVETRPSTSKMSDSESKPNWIESLSDSMFCYFYIYIPLVQILNRWFATNLSVSHTRPLISDLNCSS